MTGSDPATIDQHVETRPEESFDPFTSVELVNQRAEAATTYRNQDATKESFIASAPLNYKDPDTKRFEVIDPTLTPGLPGTDLPYFRNTAGPFEVEFAKATADPSVPLAKLLLGDGRSVSFSLLDARSVTGVVSGYTIRYPDALPGVDVELATARGGIKESVILKDRGAPRTIRYAMAYEGVAPQLNASGGIDLLATSGVDQGAVVGSIPRGTMSESSPEPGFPGATSDGVTYALTAKGLDVTAQDDWLSDPARVYPVTVDPTLNTTGTVNGGADDMSVYSYGVSDSTNVGLFVGPITYPFAFQSIAFENFPALWYWYRAHMVSVQFQAWQNGGGDCAVSRPVSVYGVTQAWTGGSGWGWPGPQFPYDVPDATTSSPGQSANGPCDHWVYWDITNLAERWTHNDIAGGLGMNGLAIYTPRAYEADWGYSARLFASSDSWVPPRLSVLWNDFDVTYQQVGDLVLPTNNQTGSTRVDVYNKGRNVLGSSDFLSCHVYRGSTFVADCPRRTTSPAIDYNQTGSYNMTIPALAPGTYTIRWDMVNTSTGGDVWYKDQYVNQLLQSFTVLPLGAAIDSSSVSANSITPTLTVNAHDADGYGTLSYKFTVCTSPDMVSGSCTTSPAQPSNSWVVPAGFLSWRSSYYWSVSISDGSAPNSTSFAVPGRITPVPAQPTNANLGKGLATTLERGVNPYSGNFNLDATDATITSGAGPQPGVVRHYNSGDGRSGSSLAFGTGWSFDYGAVVATETSGNVLVTYGDGQQVRFGKNPDGTYAGPPSAHVQLSGTQAGGYTLLDQTGNQWRFGANDGPLQSLSDPDGHILAFTYTSGKIAKAQASPSGRALTFTWTGNHITQVKTDPIAANSNQPYTWNYVYSGDNLTKVCNPKSTTACTQYFYWPIDGRNLLVSGMSPRGKATVQLSYGSGQRVATIKNASNNQTSFAYATANDAKTTTVTDPAGHTYVYIYNAAGQLSATVDQDGNTTRTNYNDLGYPIQQIDPNGHVTLMSYDIHGNVLRTVTPRTSPPTFASTVATLSSPAVWYRLGDPTGSSAVDATNGNHVGAYNGAPALGGQGALTNDPSGSVTFAQSGGSQYMSASGTGSSASVTGDATLVAWVRPDKSSGGDQAILTKIADSTHGEYELALNGLSSIVYKHSSSSGTQRFTAKYAFQLGRWYQVAAVRANQSMNFYVNGVPITGGSGHDGQWTSSGAPVPSTANFMVGGWMSGSTLNDPLSAGAQDAMVYSRALTATDLRSLYSAGIGTSYKNLVPTGSASVAAWYRLGDAPTWIAADSSGNTQYAIYNGTFGFGQSGAIQGDPDTSVAFNGTDSYVALPPSFQDVSAGISLETWVYPTALRPGAALVALGAGGGQDELMLFEYEMNSVGFITCGGSSGTDCVSLVAPPNSLPLAAWSHVVATEDPSGNVSLYVNGVQQATKPAGSTPLLRGVTRSASYLGKSPYTSQMYQGKMDESAIYRGVLLPGDVSAHYAAGLTSTVNQAQSVATYTSYYRTPYGSPVVADGAAGWWRLGEQGGSTAADSSGNNHPGAIDASLTRSRIGALVGDTNGSVLTHGGSGASLGLVNGTGITTPTTGFTLESWVNLPDTSRKGAFVATGVTATSTNHVAFGVGSGNFDTAGNHLIALYANVGYLDSGINIGVGWHHTAFRINADGSGDFFLDGLLVKHSTGLVPGGGARSSNWSLGGYRQTTSSSSYLTSGIGFQDAAVYVAALANNRIREHYLVGEWQNVDPRNNLPTSYRDGRSFSPTDPTYVTTTSYDAYGRPLAVTSPPTSDFPAGRTAAASYTVGTEPAYGGGTQPAGLTKSTADARGSTTTYVYDAKGDARQVTTPAGLVTTTNYDELGRATSVTTNAAGTTTTSYDALGRPLVVTRPAVTNSVTGAQHQARITTTYDDDENAVQTATADIAGGDATRTTTATYDDDDRVLSTSDPQGHTTSRSYDAVGRVATTTDPKGAVTQYAYTNAGRRKSVTLKGFVDIPYAGTAPRDVIVEQDSYDPAGRLAARADAMGHVTQYTYTDDNRLATAVLKDYYNSDGSKTDVMIEADSYDLAGNRTRQTTANNTQTTTYAYDAANRLVAQTLDPAGLNRTTTYSYDAANNVVQSVRSGPGGVSLTTTSTYLPSNLLSSVTTGGLQTSYTYDARGLLLNRTDPRGIPTTYTYDANGNETSVVLPPVNWEENGGASQFGQPVSRSGYDTFGELTQQTDTRGGVTNLTYDAAGYVVQTQKPSYTPPGGTAITPTTHATYDAAGNQLTSQDARGMTTTFDYDTRGRLIRTTGPPITGLGAQTSRTSYDDLNRPLLHWDPTGAVSYQGYDVLGRISVRWIFDRVPAPTSGFQTLYQHDWAGNTTSITKPAPGETSTATYDAANEQLTSVDELGKTTTTTWDGLGRRTRVTDPLGRSTRYGYDGANRLNQIAAYDRNGGLLTQQASVLDNDGNPTSVTDGRGFTTVRVFDALNRMTSLTEPVDATQTITMTFGYDRAGNVTRTTDPNANPTIKTYNSLGDIETVVEPATAAYPNASGRTTTYKYDANRNVVNVDAPGGVTRTATYNEANWLTSLSATGGGAPPASKTFGYDLDGRVTSLSTPTANDTYAYNDRGLVASAAGPGGTAAFAYDADGRLVTRTDAAGTATITYTPRSQVSTFADPISGKTQTRTYDDAGQLISETWGSGNASQRYGYDDLGRPTSATLVAGNGTSLESIGYGYDANSNVTSKSITGAGVAGSGSNSYSYDRANRLVSWTAPNNNVTNYTYDGAGNRLTAGATSYTYDQRNELLTSTTGATTSTLSYTARGTLASSAVTGGGTTSVTYDALDRLTNYGTTTYTYDALDRIATRNAAAFTYAGTDNDPISDGTWTISTDPTSGLPETLKKGSTALGAFTDRHQDLVADYVLAGGAIADTRAYDPTGNVIATTGTNNPTVGYQSQYTDPTTGLTKMQSRWYQSALAAFASRDAHNNDPTTAANINRYAYGNANSITLSDPAGYQAEDASYCASNPYAVAACVAVVLAAVGAAFGFSTENTNYRPYPRVFYCDCNKNVIAYWSLPSLHFYGGGSLMPSFGTGEITGIDEITNYIDHRLTERNPCVFMDCTGGYSGGNPGSISGCFLVCALPAPAPPPAPPPPPHSPYVQPNTATAPAVPATGPQTAPQPFKNVVARSVQSVVLGSSAGPARADAQARPTVTCAVSGALSALFSLVHVKQFVGSTAPPCSPTPSSDGRSNIRDGYEDPEPQPSSGKGSGRGPPPPPKLTAHGACGDDHDPRSRSVIIGEDMAGRVIPTAERLGADYYNPPDAPPGKWMENNRQWINDRMDEGCTIFDRGADPGRANYPDPTSPYYEMELQEIAKRGYPTTPISGSR